MNEGWSRLRCGFHSGRRLSHVPHGLARLIKITLVSQGVRHCGVAFGFRQAQGSLGDFHRFGEPATLGIGGSQRVLNNGMVAARKLTGPLRQFERPRTIALRGIRTGRQYPGQIIQCAQLRWINLSEPSCARVFQDPCIDQPAAR